MARWTRVVAAVVASLFWTTQAVPVASASALGDHLKPSVTAENGATAKGVRNDRQWLWGAAGVDLSAIGPANVEARVKEALGQAFTDGRGLPLVGPGALSIDDLLKIYRIGYERRFGFPLTEDEEDAMRERLERVRAGLKVILEELTVLVDVPGHEQVPAGQLVRIAPMVDETGLPSLVAEDVMGHSVTHVAVAAHGGRHPYQGWEEAVAKAGLPDAVAAALEGRPVSVYPPLALIEGLLANREGREALKRIILHDIGDAIREFHRDEPAGVTASVNAQIERVVQSFDAVREARRQQYLKERQQAARDRAAKLASRSQHVPYVFGLNRFFTEGKTPGTVIAQIERDLASAAVRKEIKDVRVEDLGDVVLVHVTYNGPQRSPAVDRLVTDTVTDAIAAAPEREREYDEEEPITTFSQAYHAELEGQPYESRFAALSAGPTGEFAINERGAEPIHFGIALGGGVAAFNWPIMKLLDEAVQNQLKIEGIDADALKKSRAVYEKWQEAMRLGETERAEELLQEATDLTAEAEHTGPGYTVEVERIADIVAGKKDRKVYRFIFPASAPFIHTLVDHQTAFVITGVKPRPGNKLFDPTKSLVDQDRLVAVMVDRVPGSVRDGESQNSIMFARDQSGAPALGEDVAVMSRFYLTTSGTGDAFHRGSIPVTVEEAKAGTYADQGLVRLASWAWMSWNNGRFPHGEQPGADGRFAKGEVLDQMAQSNDTTDQKMRERHLHVHESLSLLGSFQPAVTAPTAIRKADEVVESLGARYHEVPAVIERNPDGSVKLDAAGKPMVKLDPILQPSNAKAVVTFSDIKADIGATGHQKPYQFSLAALRASLRLAQRQGLIGGFDVTATGDDIHLKMWHRHGVDSEVIHDLAWHSFFRAGWAIKRIGYPELGGYKLYGHMQDFVSAEVKAVIDKGEEHRWANLTEEYMDVLEEELRAAGLPELSSMPSIRKAFEDIQAGKIAGTVVELAPPGNVRGMGAGFAEKAMSQEEVGKKWSDIENDKAAAGAFNYPTYWASRVALLLLQHGTDREKLAAALQAEVDARMPMVPLPYREKFVKELLAETLSKVTDRDLAELRRTMANGVVFETWDVLPNSRAFIDAQTENAQLMALLSAQNDHNIKRIWTKKRAGWVQDLTADEVAAIEQRVDSELLALRQEISQRRGELRQELGKRIDAVKKELLKDKKNQKLSADALAEKARSMAFDTLNPWEQVILVQGIDTVLADLRQRRVEYYKVMEFMGEDYIASISTEKLTAAAGGGVYAGKDDSVKIVLDALATLYRAVTKVAIRVNVGNARGSHWVAMRPEGRNTAIAMKWSNPVETSFRYQINADGSVVKDEATGMALAEDMYGQPEYDATRARVIEFNEVWIDTQGGFTPHGPDIDHDIEVEYPGRKTRDRITAADSPFAHDMTDTTLTTVAQGAVVAQFPNATSHVVSADAAAMAADTAHPRWIVIHSSTYEDAEDAATAHALLREQLEAMTGNGEVAVHFALAVKGASDVETAWQTADRLSNGLEVGSSGRTGLDLSAFSAVLPADGQAGELVGLLEAQVPGSTVASVIGGSSEWGQAIREASADPTTVAVVPVQPTGSDTQVAAGAEAIIAGFEAAAAGGKLNPALAARLKATQQDDGTITVPAANLSADMVGVATTYRSAVATALEEA